MDNNEKNKKNKGLFIILITCIVLFAILIVYLKFFKKDVNTNTNTNVTKFTSKYELQSNDLSDFDIYFMKEENNERNMLYSPLSIKYALSMLSLAANGNTKSQIDATLGKYTSKKYTNNANYSLANAIFIKNTFKSSVKEDYIKKLNDEFNDLFTMMILHHHIMLIHGYQIILINLLIICLMILKIMITYL